MLEFHRILLVVFTMAVGVVLAGLVPSPSAATAAGDKVPNGSEDCAAPHSAAQSSATACALTTGTPTAFNERSGGSP